MEVKRKFLTLSKISFVDSVKRSAIAEKKIAKQTIPGSVVKRGYYVSNLGYAISHESVI